MRTQVLLNVAQAGLMVALIAFILQLRGLLGELRTGALSSLNQTLLQLNGLLPKLTETISDVNRILPDVEVIVRQVRRDMDLVDDAIDEVEEAGEEAEALWDWLVGKK